MLNNLDGPSFGEGLARSVVDKQRMVQTNPKALAERESAEYRQRLANNATVTLTLEQRKKVETGDAGKIDSKRAGEGWPTPEAGSRTIDSYVGGRQHRASRANVHRPTRWSESQAKLGGGDRDETLLFPASGTELRFRK